MSDARPRLPFAGTIPLVGGLPLRRAPKLRIVDTPVAAPVVVDNQSSGLIWARRYRRKLRATDVGVIVGAVAVVFLARIGVEGAPVSVGPFPADYLTPFLLTIATWIATLGAFHTRDSRVVGVGATEYKQVMQASLLAFGVLATAFMVFQVDVRGYFILALPLGAVGLTLERWLWRKWLLHQRSYGHYLSRVIVVGSRDDVEYVVGQIDRKSGAAYYVVGAALDTDSDVSITVGDHCVPIVADFDHTASAATAMGVDAVIVAGQPPRGSQFIRNLAWELERTSAELVLASRLTDVAGPRIHFRPVEGLPLIHVEIPHFDGARHVLKRSLDIVASGLGMIALIPLLVTVSILIKIDSRGPVFFRQERCGRNQRTFHMLKFRSMVQTAEADLQGLRDQNEGSGVLFKLRNDPRVTPIGRILRKYSVDELPQLWNVFVGEMSLVGPRPPLPAEVESYETHVHRRLYIKPGLTGMWQVNGRSDLSWDESVRLDLYYVENWSLAGDIVLLWRTVKVVLRPAGAY